MPVTFRQIAAKEAKVTFSYGGEKITIIFYPNKLTEKVQAEIQAGLTNDNDLLSDLIKEWDVYEDDEHTLMFPLSRINEFGLHFKQEVGRAIGEELRPKGIPPQANT